MLFAFLNGEPKKEVMNLQGDNPCFFVLEAREEDSVIVKSPELPVSSVL